MSNTLRQVWINQGDIVLLSLRDFQDDKADVIQKYSSDEARKLKQYGELPETAKINEGPTEEDGEGLDVVEFDEVSADEDDDDDDERKDDDFDIVRLESPSLPFLPFFLWGLTCDDTGPRRRTTSRVLLPRDRRLCSSVVSPPAPARLFVRLSQCTSAVPLHRTVTLDRRRDGVWLG